MCLNIWILTEAHRQNVWIFLLAGRTQAPVWITRPRALKQAIRRSLADAGCEGLENRMLGALSGGELQRVMLAQALYPVPELLILDEPVSGVDTVGSEQFYEKISQLRHDYHMAILMVSHDLELVHLHADRAVLLNKKILCAGEVDEVYTQSLPWSVWHRGRRNDCNLSNPRNCAALFMALLQFYEKCLCGHPAHHAAARRARHDGGQ